MTVAKRLQPSMSVTAARNIAVSNGDLNCREGEDVAARATPS
jgi:hypothetical protein